MHDQVRPIYRFVQIEVGIYMENFTKDFKKSKDHPLNVRKQYYKSDIKNLYCYSMYSIVHKIINGNSKKSIGAKFSTRH